MVFDPFGRSRPLLGFCAVEVSFWKGRGLGNESSFGRLTIDSELEVAECESSVVPVHYHSKASVYQNTHFNRRCANTGIAIDVYSGCHS